ncbi:helix-turn-helix domain-containing protein [Phyllobacterium lublinensis]|uniref:helix-turn-helix domain-containing protein n=1 Tax=Phyllobacterium lublinensis TaxID=2875708 RepID=UPI00351D5A4F
MPDSPQKGQQPLNSIEAHEGAETRASSDPAVERRRWPRQPTTTAEAAIPPPALEPLTFSTRNIDAKDQFAAWQAYLSPLVDIRLPDGVSEESGFPAAHTAWNLGSMLVVQQSAPPHSFARSAAKLRSNSIDHWHLTLLRSGKTWTEVEGQVFQGKPGSVELTSLGQPFTGRATAAESLSFYLPRELFSDANVVNAALSGTYTNLLIEYMDSLEAKLASLAVPDLPRVVQTTRDMIVTWLASTAEQHASTESQGNFALMERVRRFIQRNLSSPDLTPDRLSRELGISRTRLYQLFEPSGGVLHYIQKRRLLAAHAALSNSANRQQIVEIAAAVGYTSAAHFSRAFSKEFGYSPREARNVVVPPYFAHAVPLVELGQSANSFGEWLKSLGH